MKLADAFVSVLIYQATIITEAAVTPWKGGG